MNRILIKQLCFANILLTICFITTAISQVAHPIVHQSKFDYEYEKYKNHKRWIPPSSAKYEGDSILTLLGRRAWGCCYAVDTRGNYALIGNGPTLHMLDISNPRQPTIVGEYLTDGIVYEICIKDSLAFVVGGGLLILDISNPQCLRRISEIYADFFLMRVAVVDSFAYVSGFPGITIVVDITDIFSPHFRGWIPNWSEFPICFHASNRWIFYGGYETSGIEVIDATNPDSLRRRFIDIKGDATSGYSKDSTLFVGVRNRYDYFIRILKVIAPDSGIILSQIQVSRPIHAIRVNGQILYAVSDSGIVYAIDITDLSSPFILSRYLPNAGELNLVEPRAIAFIGDIILAAQVSGLVLLDNSKPERLKRISFFPTGGEICKIVVKRNLAFIASWYSGLWIVDISDTKKPKNVSNINVGSYTVDIVVDEDKDLVYFVNYAYQYSNDTSRGLWIADISDIFNPRILSHHIGIVINPLRIIYNTLAKMGDYIVIAQVGTSKYDSTLEVVDVSNPLQPRSVSVIRSYSSPYIITIEDSILYVADAKLGLRIIDLHNPLAPIQVGIVPGAAVGIALKDTIAYIFSPYLKSVNIAIPHSPTVICTTSIVPTGFTSADVAIYNNFLYYVGGYYSGIVDISNPYNLILRRSYRWILPVSAVAANNNLVYYGSKYHGMWIFKNNLVTDVEEKVVLHSNLKFDLYQNYPNPFNSSTKIPISINQKSFITLTIYDILGRQIETIFKGELGAGKHTFQWSIDSKRKQRESGVYFIVLQAERDRSVRRAVYLK